MKKGRPNLIKYTTKGNIYLRYYSACDYDELATEMVFPGLMYGEVPDFRGGSDFQILDQLKDQIIQGQTIRHWSGTAHKVDENGEHVNDLKQGFV